MSRFRNALERRLRSTSHRTFVLWPIVLFAAEFALRQDLPRINAWALPLLVWGYLQYRLVGNYRLREGGGGPGLSHPPERLVTGGLYRWTRNPMYIGHLIFIAGLALALGSWIGVAVLVFHMVWFDRRVRGDEAHLAEIFGASYRDYGARVKRWVPGIF